MRPHHAAPLGIAPSAPGRPSENSVRDRPLAPQDFRRLTASLLMASGVDIATAAAILGHERASVLLDVYARALRAPKRAAANRLPAALYAVGAEPQLSA